MKILVVSDWFENFRWHIDNYDKKIFKDVQIKIINIPSDWRRISFFRLLKLYSKFIYQICKFDVLIFRGITIPFFIYHFLSYLGLVKSKTTNVIVEFSITYSSNSFFSKIKYKLLKSSLNSLDLLCPFSPSYSTTIIKRNNLNPKKIFPIPCAINHKLISDYPKINDHQDKEDYLLSIGRTGRDYATLLNSFKSFPNENKIIVSDKKSVKNLKFDSSVKLLFDIDLEHIFKLINNCNFVIIPLKENLFVTGVRIIYYAFRGKPVIFGDSSGLRHIFKNFKHYQMITYEPGNHIELTRKIQLLLNNPEIKLMLSKEVRIFSENNNTSENYINKLLKKIHEIY